MTYARKYFSRRYSKYYSEYSDELVMVDKYDMLDMMSAFFCSARQQWRRRIDDDMMIFSTYMI